MNMDEPFGNHVFLFIRQSHLLLSFQVELGRAVNKSSCCTSRNHSAQQAVSSIAPFDFHQTRYTAGQEHWHCSTSWQSGEWKGPTCIGVVYFRTDSWFTCLRLLSLSFLQGRCGSQCCSNRLPRRQSLGIGTCTAPSHRKAETRWVNRGTPGRFRQLPSPPSPAGQPCPTIQPSAPWVLQLQDPDRKQCNLTCLTNGLTDLIGFVHA